MLKNTIRKYYDKKYDLNCAECMLVASNEEYDLNILKQTVKSMAAFGGGMGIGSVCGAITGSIAALGIMFAEDRGHNSPQVKQMTIEFIEKFNVRLQSIECVPLKSIYFENTEDRCIKIMEVAGEILEEIVDKYREEYEIYR